VVFACYDLSCVVDFAREVPGDEAAVGVAHCLAEEIA